MKKLILIGGILAGCMIFFSSCVYEHGGIRGYGPSIDTIVDVDYVTGIELDGSMDIEIIPSDTFKVVIVAQENIAKLIIIEEIGGIAKVSYRPHINVIPTDVAKVVFYMPELYSVSLDGSGDIYVYETYESDEVFETKINGSGNITLEEIICDKLETTINGSGNIEASVVANNMETIIRGSGDISYNGNSENHTIRISGSGDVDAFDLLTETTFIEISGSGDCFVWADTLLDIYISGSGNVTYKGNPQINIETPGSGNVNSWK
jgi:hypothetical protein